MRPAPSSTPAERAGNGSTTRSSTAARKARLRRMTLESLEPRTLMAVLPPALVQNQVNISNQTTGQESSPSIAVNPLNSLQAVAVWNRIGGQLGGPAERPTQGRIEGAFTNNGGQSWTSFGAQTPFLTDPTTSNPTLPFIVGSDAGISFDRSNNFYVVQRQIGASDAVGAILLSRYDMLSGTPGAPISTKVLYEWGHPGGTTIQALLPTVAVDSSVADFIDPDTLQRQTNKFSGDVYVAWTAFNPTTTPVSSGIQIVGSSDRGQSFSAPVNVSDGGNGNTAVRLAVSQGGNGVPAGQVTAVWDDFTTLADAAPIPLDRILSDRLSGVLYQRVAGAQTGGIGDASDPGGGAAHAPAVTNFTTVISANTFDPRVITIDDLNVDVSLRHPQISELRIRLIPPPGTGLNAITLLDNQTDAGGVATGLGATGTDLGPLTPQGSILGTVFDSEALQTIVGNAGGAASTGYFRPRNPNPFARNPLSAFAGLTPAQLVGTWTLEITDFRDTAPGPPPPITQLDAWGLQFTSGLNPGIDSTVATTTVRGTLAGPFATASAASPVGIAPAPTIASDNTLGSFSPNQGRIYVTYVDRFDSRRDGPPAATNPADNTDIRLAASDDGGLTWFRLSDKVNDDSSQQDGFSGSLVDLVGPNPVVTGRAQFQPEVAVDQGTGTLVITFLDARHDAARARVATYIATSIDGGGSFGPQTFVNTPNEVFDVVARENVILGPIPENARIETTRGFGSHQGLAVLNGQVYPAYSSNLNGGPRGTTTLDIRVARTVIASGPRVVASTMGPVTATTVGNTTINNTFAADGTQQLDGFSITFDRPVDLRTFTPDDVRVIFRAPSDASSSAGTAVAVASITPVNPTGPTNSTRFLATTFLVRFTSRQSMVGTYSYAVGPDISDMIRSVDTMFTSLATSTRTSTDVPRAISESTPATPITSTLAVSGIAPGRVIEDVNVTLSLRHTFDSDLRITLIAPDGTRIVLSNRRGGSGNDFTNTTFDDQAGTPIGNGTPPFANQSFIPDERLATLIAKNPNGTWTLEIADLEPNLEVGTLDNWSLSIRTGIVTSTVIDSNQADQNANATDGEADADTYAAPRSTGSTPLVAPYNLTTLPLMVSGPRIVGTSVIGGTGADNLVLNATVSAIDVTFDRDMRGSTFTTADILRVTGPVGEIPGPYTIQAVSLRTFRIGFATQIYSGTYSILIGSDIESLTENPATPGFGYKVDTNRNAGLDALRGVVDPTTGTTTLVTELTSVPVPITASGSISSTIVVTDDFLIQDLDLRLNITHPNDPDLSAVLIAPNGTEIRLFTGVGITGNTLANFTDTVFDDQAPTPIQNGGAPFRGRFNPQEPLNALVGRSSAGIWTLRITNASATETGTLNNWALLLRKPLPGTGLGEVVSDRTTVDFRIFNANPTDPVATSAWIPVGPGSIAGQSSAGRVGGLAIDPSDPSGNTVYVAGASGGVWKTTNFLTPSNLGPTYHPLTDFGPTFAINIGSLAVYGRNSDPNQSIIFAATGEGNTGSPGVGFLRSTDGGATWTLLDSSRNVDAAGNILPINSPLRNHIFVGSTSFKVVVDPRPTVTGETIVYAAVSGTSGGLWRSLDTGKTWQLMRAGQATDVVLDPNSGPINAVSNPTGNLQIVYAAFRAEGVFLSQNQGTVFGLMVGGVGNPLVRDGGNSPPSSIPVDAPLDVPNGAKGRIVLGKPELIPASEPNAELQNRLYQGWLYAAVATSGGSPGNRQGDRLDGLYMTKDFGRNWTKVQIPNLPGPFRAPRAVPTNDESVPDEYDIGGGPPFGQANYDLILLVDPVNPNVVYLGGSRNGQQSALLRIDTTGIADSHAFYHDNDNPDGGALRINTTSTVTVTSADPPPANPLGLPTPTAAPFINLLQDPANPFVASSTVLVSNTARFGNSGSDVRWVPFDVAVPGQNDMQRAVAMRDPLTGRSRLIFGTDHGVSTALDAGRDGLLIRSIGNVQDVTSGGGNLAIVNGSRNGNLQITQFYFGAAQPSQLAADISRVRGFFYGEAQDDGHPSSDPNILNNGNIRWSPPGRGDGTGVATDQTGTGTVYQYKWPCCGGGTTDFFQVDGVGRTSGLIQQNLPGDVPDPQWPFLGGSNFAVNPINGDQIIMTSAAGRVFGTVNQGRFWLPIAEPGALDGTPAQALAYGAPDPADPTGSTNSFLYAGTDGGRIFVTFTGGGDASGANWRNISAGLENDGSAVRAIITNPTRGSREAYAVTGRGLYHMADSGAAGARWRNITGDLFSQMHNPFNSAALGTDTQARYLTSIQADWRYIIPDNFNNPNGSSHPMLYVAGEGGVYRSLDDGVTWRLFPDTDLNSAPREGGYLPNAHVTDLDLSLGNINPTTGRPNVATGENLLLATTYGRGSFAIRLAPIVFPNTAGNEMILRLSPTLPAPDGSDSGADPTDGRTKVTEPVIEGLSEQTAFGNSVTIAVYDVSALTAQERIDFRAGRLILPAVPLVAGTEVTDGNGRFAVKIAPGHFLPQVTDGPKTLWIQATNGSGTKGNLAELNFDLDTTLPALVTDPRSPAPGNPAPDLDPPLKDRPDLVAASDTGFSSSDNVTSVNNVPNPNNPSLTRYLTFTVFLAENEPLGTRVFLVRRNDNQIVDSKFAVRTSPGVLTVTLEDKTPIPADGTYFYYAYQVDLAGNQGLNSQELAVLVDTRAPVTPNAPVLEVNSDSGTKGDNITNVNQPFFTGLVAASDLGTGGLIQILDAGGNVVGSVLTSDPVNFDPITGRYRIQATTALPNGTYRLQTRVRDLAGNFSALSAPTVVTILARTIASPTVRLVPQDDTGTPGDNITSNVRPRLVGEATTGLSGLDTLYVQLKQDGVVVSPIDPARIAIGLDGKYQITFPADLVKGTYVISVMVSDVAGNSAESTPLRLRIIPADGVDDPENPGESPGVPTLFLRPADDSGTKGDNTTVVRRPHFEGKAFFADNSIAAGAVVELSTDDGIVRGTATSDAEGNFTLRLQNDLGNGVTTLKARMRDIAGNPSVAFASAPLVLKITFADGDIDNDGKADLDSFNPTTGLFTFTSDVASPTPTVTTDTPFSTRQGDIPFQGDFNGDGKIDYGFYRYATGEWFVKPSGASAYLFAFGTGGNDLPVPADYDGDGRTDFATWRQSDGNWRYFGSRDNKTTTRQFGTPGLDQPVPADYDGDGKADLAVYRTSLGQWRALLSSGATSIPGTFNPATVDVPFPNATLGTPNASVPVPADYNGDGKADLAVFSRATAIWQVAQSGGSPIEVGFGAINIDTPAPADYDGDGKADLAVFRTTSASWLIRRSAGGADLSVNSGQANNIPLLSPLQPFRYAVPSTPGPNPGPTPPPTPPPGGGTTNPPTTGGGPIVVTTTPPAPTVRAVRIRKVAKQRVVQVDYNNVTQADSVQNLANYTFVNAGKDGRFNTRDDVKVRFRRASFIGGTVTLTPRKKLVGNPPMRLTVTGLDGGVPSVNFLGRRPKA